MAMEPISFFLSLLVHPLLVEVLAMNIMPAYDFDFHHYLLIPTTRETNYTKVRTVFVSLFSRIRFPSSTITLENTFLFPSINVPTSIWFENSQEHFVW